jgi:predicted alpha-1,6-mannanase (GH76 family)
VCGGGLWWTRAKTYKNAIPNELFMLIASRLHQRTTSHADRASGYLDWALREWRWFRASGMISPAGLVNDGLTADCANNAGTTWTYNQGVIIGGLAVLYEITRDGAYLGQAEAIAATALRDLTVPPGILVEPYEQQTSAGDHDRPQFKGIFVRHLYEVYQHSPRTEYRDFILANATSLWQNSRNGRNQVGLAWTGPFDSADAVRQEGSWADFGGLRSLQTQWTGGSIGAVRELWLCRVRSGSWRRFCSPILLDRPSLRGTRMPSGFGRCWTAFTMRWRRRWSGPGRRSRSSSAMR